MLKDAALRRAAAWLLAGFLYFLWPWDLIPDFIPLAGQVDDTLMTAFAAYMAYKALKEYWENGPASVRRIFEEAEDDSDPCKVLGVGRQASPEVIKAAYKARMAEYHPDKVNHLGAELRALAEKKTKAIQQAYEKLGGT